MKTKFARESYEANFTHVYIAAFLDNTLTKSVYISKEKEIIFQNMY